MREGKGGTVRLRDRLNESPVERAGRDLPVVRTRLAAARRRERSLLRKLGQRAVEVLALKGRLDSRDPEARIVLEDLLRIHQEVSLLENRVKRLRAPRTPRPEPLPFPPGTDAHFPFSR